MYQRSGTLRKGSTVLATVALVASLLAAGATTAIAVSDTPDELSNVTACLGEAMEVREFTDVSDDHAFFDSINCLAHYGITIGTGDGTTYSPEEPVKRWQMMLFLTRALEPAGVNLRAARAQNFTDLDGLNDEARDAIDLLVSNGIARPASSREFDAHSDIDRAEMAELLLRFLEAAGPVVSFDSDGDILLDANDDGIQSEPDDYFEDARDLVPVAADSAISAAYELGITTGADPTPASGTRQPGLDFYYRPRSAVTRGQMAAFIIRTLGHTLARPKGLSAQYDGNEIRVSLRDDDFEPVDGAPIDAFFIDTDGANRAFTSRGACDEVDFVDGSYLCEIDSSDLTTDDEGEVSLTVPDLVLDGTDTTMWVWTGRDGDEVGRNTDLFPLEIEPSLQPQGAVSARLTTAFKGSKARFGTSVTFTLQLLDGQGNTVSTGINGQGPAEWVFTEEELEEASSTVDGIRQGDENLRYKPAERTVRTDSRGRFTFSVSVSDPSRGSAGDSRTRTFTLVPGSNAPTTDITADKNIQPIEGTPGAYFLEFSDAPPDVTQAVVRLTTTNRYVNIPVGGSARNTAIVTVHNEYGEALSAATVSLRSDESNITTQSFAVGRDGTHRFSYSYNGAGNEVETLTVTVDPDGSGDAEPLAAESLPDRTAYVFWPDLTDRPASANGVTYAVLFGDLDRDEIIVDTDPEDSTDPWPSSRTTPELLEYDSNDRFDVQGPNDEAPRPVNTIEDFEKALAEFLAKDPDGDSGVGACLEWSRFRQPRNPADIRLWRVGPDGACPSPS